MTCLARGRRGVWKSGLGNSVTYVCDEEESGSSVFVDKDAEDFCSVEGDDEWSSTSEADFREEGREEENGVDEWWLEWRFPPEERLSWGMYALTQSLPVALPVL